MKGKFHFFYLFAFVIAVLFVSCTPNDSEDQVDSTQMIQDENGDSGDVSQEGTEGDNTDQTTQDNNGNSDNTSQEGTEGGGILIKPPKTTMAIQMALTREKPKW